MSAVARVRPVLVHLGVGNNPARARMLIYHKGLENMIDIYPDFVSPSRVHHSLIIAVNRRPRSVQAIKMLKANKFPIQETFKQLRQEQKEQRQQKKNKKS